ncbi:MAG: efflux RND transporter periplasmic adaptor subunit [Acidobacteria bacterium]|nr:efflux RND transporter periplasmic adaptor subunit [Acidobacteriota bacterium]
MRFGPTSLRVATVVAKGLQRPKLRDDLVVSEQVVAGQRSFVIKIRETDSYSRYGTLAWQILKLCDGTRTPAEVTAAINELYPDQPLREDEVLDFVEGTDPNVWERSLAEKNLAILEKIRDERKKRVDRSSLLYIYFPAFDPDKFLERIHPYLKWMYTREFVIVCVILFALTGLIVASDFERVRADTKEFYNFINKSAYDIWVFWVLLLFVTAVHETGHGLTCKNFGGEVHQMGFMLLFFTPSFYTDCTDMHLFDRTSKRLWTIFAGIWIELVVCALATFVWYLSPPGSFIGDLGYKTLLLTGVSGVFINLNPLMKFDGYFALAQWLEIDNMREQAFNYFKLWIQKHLLRREVELPPVGKKRRRIFLVYGALATYWGVLILFVVTMFMKNIFTAKFGDTLGILLTGGVVYLLLRRRLGNFLPGLMARIEGAKMQGIAWRPTRRQLIGAGVAVVILLIPSPIQVATEFILEPGEKAEVRAQTDGWVKEVSVQEGQEVEAGAVLAVLTNPELETRAATLEQERALAERRWLAARAVNNLGEAQKHQQEAQRLGTALQEARQKRDALVLRAPLAGTVTTPQVEQRVGDYLAAGEEFARVADRRRMRARVLVRDWELEDVSEGAKVKLNVRAYPLRGFEGTVAQILPAAATDRPVSDPKAVERKGQELTNFFAVVLELPNEDGVLREGMTGTAKIYGPRHLIGVKLGRSAYRWAASLIW